MMTDEKLSEVLELVKNAASISWSDDDTDRRLMTIVQDAEVKLNHILGAEMDYSAPGAHRSLFLNYCLYVWNGVEKDFKDNYIKDIYEVRRINEVKQYEGNKNLY